MKLNREQLLELENYLDELYDYTEFDNDTYVDVKKVIKKARRELLDEQNTINHFDSY